MRLEGATLAEVAEALECSLATAATLAREGLEMRELMSLAERAAVAEECLRRHLALAHDARRLRAQAEGEGELAEWSRLAVVEQRSLDAAAKLAGVEDGQTLQLGQAEDPIAAGLAQLAASLAAPSAEDE